MKYGYDGPEPKRRAGGFVFKAGVPREIDSDMLTDSILAQFGEAGIAACGDAPEQATTVEYGPITGNAQTVTETPDEPGANSLDLTSMTQAELQDQCRALGLASYGSKQQMIARIEGAE